MFNVSSSMLPRRIHRFEQGSTRFEGLVGCSAPATPHSFAWGAVYPLNPVHLGYPCSVLMRFEPLMPMMEMINHDNRTQHSGLRTLDSLIMANQVHH